MFDSSPGSRLTTCDCRQDAKFQKMHPAAKKALILLTAQVLPLHFENADLCCLSAAEAAALALSQVTRQTAAIPAALQDDFSRVIGLAPTLLDELLTILLRQRPPFGASVARILPQARWP